MRKPRGSGPFLPLLAALLSVGCSCFNPYCQGATGLLPSVSASRLDAPGVRVAAAGAAQVPGPRQEQPANPYVPAFGALTREVYRVSSGAGFRIEVREVLVGPGQKASRIVMPGPAVVEVRSGAGRFTVGADSRDRGAGSTFALPEGQALDIENRVAVPITLRLQVVVAE